MSSHVVSYRTNFTVFAALMVLLVATIGAAYIPLPSAANLAIAMAIATTKAALIVLYFMHVRYSNRLTWVFSAAALLWLALLLGLTLADYLSRGWLDIPGK